MAARSILAVPGLAATSPLFLFDLYELAARNGWDADALAAVMSSESGFQPGAKNPKATASGLIQFTEATAKGLGTTTAAIRSMSAVDQLPLVERYFKRAFAGRPLIDVDGGARRGPDVRPVDYYLALWGSGIGKPPEFVLARKSDPKSFNGGTENLYTLNAGLDRNNDDEIRVSDLADFVAQTQARAGGRRLPVPLVDPSAAPAPSPSVPRPSPSPSSSAPFVRRRQEPLPVLSLGSYGPAVELARLLAGYAPGDEFDAGFRKHLEVLGPVYTIDHVVGPLSWAALLGALRLRNDAAARARGTGDG